jgi:hypothetical protein
MTRRQAVRATATLVALGAFALMPASANGGTALPPARPNALTLTSGWLGSRSASAAQDGVATFRFPQQFAQADLLVALVGLDGPDTVPVGLHATATTARFSDPLHLVWTRRAHVSARHDVGPVLETFGASVAEIWTANPPPGWNPVADPIRVTNNFPLTNDDGFAVTIAAFSSGRVAETATTDGMNGDPEQLVLAVPQHSAIYAATFSGRRNAAFTPMAGYHLAVERRAGDDTAAVLASDDRDLASGMQTLGYTAPSPGDFWELAAVVIGPTDRG